jgi:hypothetical protein
MCYTGAYFVLSIAGLSDAQRSEVRSILTTALPKRWQSQIRFPAAKTSELLKALGEPTCGPFNFNLSSFLRAFCRLHGFYSSRLE